MSQTTADPFEYVAEKLKLNDELRSAATELILLNPDLLKGQYKNIGELSSEAEIISENGNLLVAENRYATAAKLALYENNPTEAKRLLLKCVSINQAKNGIYKLALDNFDSVSQCVLEFYRAKSSTV